VRDNLKRLAEKLRATGIDWLLPVLGLVIIFSIILFTKSQTQNSDNLLVMLWSSMVTVYISTVIFGSIFYREYVRDIDYGYVPKISVVVPAKNEEGNVYTTIRKCFETDYPKNLIEVIAINDGSTDGTLAEMNKAKADFKSVIVISFKTNQGKRAAIYKAVNIASGDILVNIDSDSFVDKLAFRHLVKYFKDETIGAVSAHTYPSNKDKNLLTKLQAVYYFSSYRSMKAKESMFGNVLCCPGCCSAFRRKFLLEVLDEWYDERFLGQKITWGDDRALTNHILKAGHKVFYSTEAVAYTIVPDNWRTFLTQQIRWKKSWFANTYCASKFMFKRDPFFASTYFLPQSCMTLFSPFIALTVLIISPVFFGSISTIYLVGVLTMALLYTFHYLLCCDDLDRKYALYMPVWCLLNMLFLSFLLLLAIKDIKNAGWGTR
jgi:hyaluronan synthase